MKKFIAIFGIVALSATVSTSAQAKGVSIKSGSSTIRPGATFSAPKPITQTFTTQASNKTLTNQIGNNKTITTLTKSNTQQLTKLTNTKVGQTFKTTSGKTIAYQCCPAKLQHCCLGCNYCNWTSFCWFGNLGCRGCFCPVRCCWYYWYEPFCCYLPCTYMETYVPVQVAMNSQPPVNVNVNTNTNVNQNGQGSGGLGPVNGSGGQGKVNNGPGGQDPDGSGPGDASQGEGQDPDGSGPGDSGQVGGQDPNVPPSGATLSPKKGPKK